MAEGSSSCATAVEKAEAEEAEAKVWALPYPEIEAERVDAERADAERAEALHALRHCSEASLIRAIRESVTTGKRTSQGSLHVTRLRLFLYDTYYNPSSEDIDFERSLWVAQQYKRAHGLDDVRVERWDASGCLEESKDIEDLLADPDACAAFERAIRFVGSWTLVFEFFE